MWWCLKICYLKRNEQALLKTSDGQKLILGPGLILLDSKIEMLKRYATGLKNGEYAKVIDENTGACRIEKGPQRLWLSATERIFQKFKAIQLKHHESIEVYNHETGTTRVEKGKKEFMLCASEQVLNDKKAIGKLKAGMAKLNKRLSLKGYHDVVKSKMIVIMYGYLNFRFLILL